MRISRLSRPTLEDMNQAAEAVATKCLEVMPEVDPVTIHIAGRQRMLMQQMSKEAILVALEQDPEENRARVQATVDTWLNVHWALLHGREANLTSGVTALKRTADVCILRHMKIVLE